MTAERNPYHSSAGVRPPKAKPEPLPPETDETVADPANGARVPRCRLCGLPARDTNPIKVGLWLNGTDRFVLKLCGRCEADLPKFDPLADMLDVTQLDDLTQAAIR